CEASTPPPDPPRSGFVQPANQPDIPQPASPAVVCRLSATLGIYAAPLHCTSQPISLDQLTCCLY
ncbi:MAG TPA: hypothetical protein PLB04_18415, partial [Nitrospira sp.]|nr:hypothetical protein [Nitrospira sp.]